MIITSRLDYKDLVYKIMSQGANVGGTYEELGVKLDVKFRTTEEIAEMLDIDDDFVYDFLRAILANEEKQLGVYDTSKYLFIVPAVKKAIKQIVLDSEKTRRAVISFPEEHCFQTIQFIVRDKTVHVMCFMRSCDVVKNLRKDIWLCSWLADVFASHYKEVTGEELYDKHYINMMVGSLHVYQSDMEV